MKTALLIGMLAIPIASFQLGVWFMRVRTGRKPVGKPLENRPCGYSTGEAQAFWAAQGDEGLKRELHFLKLDLLFPVLYGLGLLAGLLIGWHLLGGGFSIVWCALPVSAAMLADGVENHLQIDQLRKFTAGEPLQHEVIRSASRATQVKLVAFAISVSLLLVLLVMAWRAPAG